MSETPLSLQRPGTGITAAFLIQLGAICRPAEWPAVSHHQLYQDDLLIKSITPSDGTIVVPDAPGLGYKIDTNAIDRLTVPETELQPVSDRLIEIMWSEGVTMYYSGRNDRLLDHARQGTSPYLNQDISIRMIPNDGSDQWDDLVTRTRNEPVLRNEPLFR